MGGRTHGGTRSALEMLERCHQKTIDKIALLVDAADRWKAGGERDALADIDDVLRFLLQAGRRHALDEEQSIFPRLPEGGDLDDVIRVLRAEHRDHHRETQVLEELMAQRSPDADELAHCAQRISSAYRAHILLEDSKLMPVVRTLPAATLGKIHDEMQGRRGR